MKASSLYKNILFLSLFATGLSGIVAEYCFATLSTYLVGNSVKQWAIIISLMLFSMGIGSRLTQVLKGNLFQWFILTEFALSIIVAFSAVSTYFLSSYVPVISIYIYAMSMLTGALIGMELPIAVRLNNQFQTLELNVSNVLEKDYYGSLIGGLFFVFIGLPYLGLTYTPFILGFINLIVALVFLFTFKERFSKNLFSSLFLLGVVIVFILFLGSVFSEKIIFYGEQHRYKDKIVYQGESAYQKIVITEWKNDNWLYLNNNLQFSTLDEPLYHEVLVHPIMHLLDEPKNVLILGGGDGCAARELLKYKNINKITLVDLDKKLTDLFSTKDFLLEINNRSLLNDKVEVINQDGFRFLEETKAFFDLIIIDLPDPRTVELARLYSKEFYTLCSLKLRPKGGIITQSGSPYYTPEAFKCIERTISSAGYSTLAIHNQILTMGEWGWVIGVKEKVTKQQIKNKLAAYDETKIKTEWLNNESMQLITSFGKNYFGSIKDDSIKINKINNPSLYQYFHKGNWETY